MPVAGMWARTEAWAFVVAEGGVVWFGEEANSVACRGPGHSPPSSLTRRPGMIPLSPPHAALITKVTGTHVLVTVDGATQTAPSVFR